MVFPPNWLIVEAAHTTPPLEPLAVTVNPAPAYKVIRWVPVATGVSVDPLSWKDFKKSPSA